MERSEDYMNGTKVHEPECSTCELIKTGGIFFDAECSDHPKKKLFFKGYTGHKFFNYDED